MEKSIITGIVINFGQMRVTLTQVPDRPGIAWQLFSALAAMGIPVGTIVQNSAMTATTDITFTMHCKYLMDTIPLIQRITRDIGNVWSTGRTRHQYQYDPDL